MEELQQTVRLDPNNFTARLKLANAYLLAYAAAKDKNPEFLARAEQFANEILARDDKNPDGHILMANVLSLKGDQKQAEEKIKYAISLDPKRVESYVGLAKFYLQTNRTSEAEPPTSRPSRSTSARRWRASSTAAISCRRAAPPT